MTILKLILLGYKFGWNDSYHDSYSIVEVQE